MTLNSTKPAFRMGTGLKVAVGVALLILIGLGTWQARKVGPKAALIADIEAGLAADPVDLFQLTAKSGPLPAYQRVGFTGRFMHNKPMALFGTNVSGRAGYHLYGLMEVPQVGQVVASYGWVAFDADQPDLPQNMRQWRGLLLPVGRPGAFTPDNDPEANIWYWADIDAMASQQKGASSIDQRIILDDISAEDVVLGGQARIDIPNNHFEYMLTWYGLAVALLGVFLAYGFTRGQRD